MRYQQAKDTRTIKMYGVINSREYEGGLALIFRDTLALGGEDVRLLGPSIAVAMRHLETVVHALV